MIRLFTNYYEDKNPQRNREILECLSRNTHNENIFHIHFLCDDLSFQYESTERYAVRMMEQRPTFSDFFSIANETCQRGDIAIISNSDIFFDETIKLAENIKENECYALSRWDVKANGMAIPFHRHDSQDVWIFRTPIKEIPGADLNLGKAGIDNRIAYLLKQNGYKVTNPCKSIHAFHLHLSGIRNYIVGNKVERIPGPYEMVIPTEL